MSYDVVVIGAGAAGLLAASRAAERGRSTLLLEKNRKPGVKILMSGGTRCNITQATDNRGIVRAFGTAGRFLHSPLAALGVDETIALFEAEGVVTKVEETGKVFPVSNRAIDVLQALLRRLERSGATLVMAEPVLDIALRAVPGNGGVSVPAWQIVTANRTIECESIILTTGGRSYPGSGTTGDGYAWLTRLGHTIVTPRPALVPITIQAPWTAELRGITIPDVRLQVLDHDRTLDSRRGSLLFAHFGLSGPVALDASRVISTHASPSALRLVIDFLPGMTGEELDQYLKSQSVQSGKQLLAVVLAEYLPRRLVDALLANTGLAADRKAAALSRVERARLVSTLKQLTIPITGTLGFEKAEVTTGGVSLDEVDSRTCQSKLCSGLYLAGEILDLDGPIGGYNFQAAWSTGYLAGSRA
jgi:predicted Rossmann fold flavoprotein